MAQKANALGDYLRARREQVRPEDVGLAAGSRRRVRGLRREELATLAGISAAYYLRLEQGRDARPSTPVVEALARALRLDAMATEHLHQLAIAGDGRTPRGGPETAADMLDEVIAQFAMPALIATRYQDVLAANACARALSPGFAPGENYLRWRLLEPAAREFFVDWDEATDVAVSGLRETAGGDVDDPRLSALIDELSAASPRFRELWARRCGLPHRCPAHAPPAGRRTSSPPEPPERAPLWRAAAADLSRRCRQRVRRGTREAALPGGRMIMRDVSEI
jgi:transcriptional regulator with XRE-family HTH domain